MGQEIALSVVDTAEQAFEARLLALVLNGVTSVHSRRSYRTSLVRFFCWIRTSGSGPNFTKALVGEYRASLLASGLSAVTVNLRLAPVRRLAREMADNGLHDPAVAAAVGRVTGVARHGTRLGNFADQRTGQRSAERPQSENPGRQARPGDPWLY